MSVLINNTVLSNLAAVEQLELLPVLYGRVYLAHAVYEETQRGADEGYQFLTTLNQHIYPFQTDGQRLISMVL